MVLYVKKVKFKKLFMSDDCFSATMYLCIKPDQNFLNLFFVAIKAV